MSITTGQNGVAGDFINNSEANATPSSDAGRVVKLESNGVFHGRFLDVGFGDGSDGDATLDGSTNYNTWTSRSGSIYTMTKDSYLDDLTVNTGVTLRTDGYRLFVRNVLDGAGTIEWGVPNPGGNAGIGGGGSNPGGASGGAQSGSGQLKNVAGSNGGAGKSDGATTGAGENPGVAGSNEIACIGSAGASGGNGGLGNSGDVNSSGGAGGTVTATIHKFGVFRALTTLMIDLSAALAFVRITPAGGAGGGAGGADSSTSFGSGPGGGGGASGGIVFIAARIWKGTFTIKSIGGAGGNGGAGSGGETGGGGGGAGGNGGCTVVLYGRKLWTGSYNVAGGAGGTGGASGGGATATAGSNGTTGTAGTSYEIEACTLV